MAFWSAINLKEISYVDSDKFSFANYNYLESRLFPCFHQCQINNHYTPLYFCDTSAIGNLWWEARYGMFIGQNFDLPPYSAIHSIGFHMLYCFSYMLSGRAKMIISDAIKKKWNISINYLFIQLQAKNNRMITTTNEHEGREWCEK